MHWPNENWLHHALMQKVWRGNLDFEGFLGERASIQPGGVLSLRSSAQGGGEGDNTYRVRQTSGPRRTGSWRTASPGRSASRTTLASLCDDRQLLGWRILEPAETPHRWKNWLGCPKIRSILWIKKCWLTKKYVWSW